VELGERVPELPLFSGSILLEYFYPKIRFSTPALSALLALAGQMCLSCIEIFTDITRGQKNELGKLLPEVDLLTARNIREYAIRKFDSPRMGQILAASVEGQKALAGQICLS
jgi:hypothetical protein